METDTSERAEETTREPPGGSFSTNQVARVVVSLVLVVLLLGIGFGAFSALASLRKPPTREARTPPRTAVQVLRPALVDHQEWLTGYGRARALRRTTLIAEVEARVVWTSPSLEAGTAVEEGEPLVRLDARDFEVAATEARASLAQTRARETRLGAERSSLEGRLEVTREEVATARRELDRLTSLASEGRASESEVDRQRLQVASRRLAERNLQGQLETNAAELESVAAELEAARSRVARVELSLERTEITAPYAAVVESRDVQVGSVVGRGVPLATLFDPTAVEIPVRLPASRFGQVGLAAPAHVKLRESSDTHWEGLVSRLDASVDPATRTFAAYLVVRGEDGAPSPVPPGAFVVGSVRGPLYQDVYVVPRDALVDGRLFLVDRVDDSEATLRAVRPTLRRTLADLALIEGRGDAALPADAQVVVTNMDEVADGSRVRIVATPTESGDELR